VFNYRVTALIGGVSAGIIANGATSPITVTGLTNGTSYTFTVQAQNAIGFGTLSAASNSVTPAGPPALCSATTPVVAGAISLRAAVARSSGISPLAVFFDATATTSTSTTKPFHDIEYRWDFGDPGSGNWTSTPTMPNISRNTARGAVAGHVYEPGPGGFSAGIANFTAIVTAFDGTSTATCSIPIAVTDANTAFTGSNTICFSNSADFTGCPTGATQAAPTANFSTVISGSYATGKRLLFHAGHTFVTTTGVDLDKAGPTTLGAFPIGGSKAIINFSLTGSAPNAGITVRTTTNDLRVMDLEIAGAGGVNTVGIGSDGYTPSRVTHLRLNVHDVNHGIKPYGTDQAMIQDCTIANMSGTPGSFSGHAIIFGQSNVTTAGLSNKYTAVLGNIVSLGTVDHGQTYGIRGELARWAVISNNHVDIGPIGKFGNIKIASIKVFSNPEDVTKFVIVSDNRLPRGPVSFGVIGTGPNTAGIDERSQDIIIERNWFEGMPGTGGGGNVMINAAVPLITVRDNLLNTTSGNTGGGYPILVQFVGAAASPPTNNVSIYNNTLFGSDASTFTGALQAIRIQGPVTLTARNNLAYFPVLNAAVMFSDASGGTATITATNNTCDTNNCTTRIRTSPLFTATPPAAPADWKPTAGSYAIAGGLFVPVFSDFFLAPQLTPPDMGAVNH